MGFELAAFRSETQSPNSPRHTPSAAVMAVDGPRLNDWEQGRILSEPLQAPAPHAFVISSDDCYITQIF